MWNPFSVSEMSEKKVKTEEVGDGMYKVIGLVSHLLDLAS